MKTESPTARACTFVVSIVVCAMALAACAHGRSSPPEPDPPAEIVQTEATGHTDLVQALASSRDGRQLASASLDGTVRIWRAEDASPVQTFDHQCTNQRGEPWIYDVALDRAGGTVALACQTETKLWSIQDERFVDSLPTGRDSDDLPARYAVEFDASGQFLAQVSWQSPGGTIRVWSTPTRTLLHEIEGYGPVAFSPDAAAIAHSVPDDDSPQSEKKTITLGALLTKDDQQRVRLTSLSDGRPIRTLDGEYLADDALAFSPNGAWIAGTDGDRVTLWRRDNGERAWSKRVSLQGRRAWPRANPVYTIAFDEAGEHIVVGTQSGSLGRLTLNSTSWKPLAQHRRGWASEPDVSRPIDYPDMFYFRPNMQTFSPDGRWMAATSGDTRIWLYRLDATR